MEKVVLIFFEETHGLIGVAKNYHNAVSFLIELGWLDDERTIWDGKNDREIPEILGTEWKDLLLCQWDMKKFNEFFEGVFYLYPEEIYGGE